MIVPHLSRVANKDLVVEEIHSVVIFLERPNMDFTVSSFVSHCVRCLNQRKNDEVFPGLAKDRLLRGTSFAVNRRMGHGVGAAWILVVILQALSPAASAQQENNDYYAPRPTNTEKQLFNNVQGHHLAPGRAAMEKGEFPPALEHFEFILAYYPNHPQALFALSELCLKWKHLTCDLKVEQWLQKAIARNPDAAQSYVVQAMHLHRKNKLDDAVKVYKRAIELAPNSVNAHYNLGLAYADLKQYDLANLHAQKSLALGANLPGLRTRLEKVGKWNPNVSLPEPESQPAAEPTPSAPRKTAE